MSAFCIMVSFLITNGLSMKTCLQVCVCVCACVCVVQELKNNFLIYGKIKIYNFHSRYHFQNKKELYKPFDS